MEAVEYRGIPGHPGYRVGSDGSVWSCKRKLGVGKYDTLGHWRLRKLTVASNGYFQVTLGRPVCLVHRLVLLSFVGPPPEGTEACHWDGNRLNNRLKNLRWDTPLANQQDRVRQGTSEHGERNPSAKLTEADVRAIRLLSRAGRLQKDIAAQYRVRRTTVSAILCGRSWGWLT